MTITPPAPAFTHVYDDFADFVIEEISPQKILDFKASPAAQRRVDKLIERLKADKITPEERAELEEVARIELLMRVLKTRAMAALQSK